MVTNIPGSEELFTVEKYKKELAKPYSKLDLYLFRTFDFSVGNSGLISNLNKAESATSAIPVIANSTLYIYEGKPEETSLSELDAYLNQNDIINVSENVSLILSPCNTSPGFGMKIQVWQVETKHWIVFQAQVDITVWIEKSIVKYSAQYVIENFQLVQ